MFKCDETVFLVPVYARDSDENLDFYLIYFKIFRRERNIRIINYHIIVVKIKKIVNLQLTTNIMRLLTDGGTPLDAMHKYAPMWKRLIRVRFRTGPSTLCTVTHTKTRNYNIIHSRIIHIICIYIYTLYKWHISVENL